MSADVPPPGHQVAVMTVHERQRREAVMFQLEDPVGMIERRRNANERHRPSSATHFRIVVHIASRAKYAAGVVDITIDGDRARFRVEGLHKLWCLRSELTIPLAHITNVQHDAAQVGTWWHGLKLMGTDVPGAFAAGTFYYHGELVFWDVRHPEQTIIVSLADERYRKLIVEVADPAAVVRLFGGVIRHSHR